MADDPVGAEPLYYADELPRRAAGLTAFGQPPPTTPTHLTLTRQRGDWYLIYQSAARTWERVDNWAGFHGIDNARRWIRSRHWPAVTVVVEEQR